MEFRQLGRTGESVSTIGMGTWKIGVYTDLAEKVKQVQALRRGIELGCNLIDTAETYADGKSEEVVAEAVRDVRKDIFIASKVSPENLHHDDVIEACIRSLKRLGTSYIDLYQVHWPNPKVSMRETMAAMEELVRDGRIRYIGVSNFSVQQTKEAREALSKSELVSNQVEYSLRSRAVEADVLPYCKREKLTLIAYTPLARGNVPEAMIPQAICEKYRMTPIQVMLNWVTRSESVVAVPKSADVMHIEENASSVSARFSETEYRTIGSS
ncbi:MAG: aldo/keto reductase [Nitrososphaerales archaeon]